mgnify:CR=1 FL=1
MYHPKSSESIVEIELKPFLHTDIKDVMNWVLTPGFSVQLQQGEYDGKLSRNFFEKRIVAGNLGSTSDLLFKVLDQQSQQLIGHCGLKNIDEVNRSAELSHVVVGPLRLRGMGLDSKIIFSLMRIAFQVLQMNRLYAKILTFDRNSITLYKSLGFQVEGNFPESFKHQDKYWDLVQLAILKSHWKKLHNSSSLN